MRESLPIAVQDPEHMCLLGLLLKGFLAKQLGDPKLHRRAATLGGEFELGAGAMRVTLAFLPMGIEIRHGRAIRPRATLGGEMQELVAVASGAGLARAVRAFLTGRLRVGGNPLAALRLARVLLAEASPDRPG